MSKALFILGMHRSGTSALAGVMGLRGAELGGKLMAAASDNERGFFEHERAVQIHEELLTRLGHRWCDGIPLPEGWMETEAAAQAQSQLAALLDLDFLGAPLWAIKDPRLSLLLPLWLPLLKERGITPHAIIAWRNPSEVAASLKKRDQLEEEPALLCWLAYTLESLKYAADLPHSILRYDALLADWKTETDRLAQELKLEWPQCPVEEINTFLAPELRHHQQGGFGIQDSGFRELVEECLCLLQQPNATALDALHRKWLMFSRPLAPLLRSARLAEAELSTRALNAEHRARDLEKQREEMRMNFLKSIEREKETLVHFRMMESALRAAEQKLAELHESTSWKITEPLRKAKQWVAPDNTDSS